MNMFFFTVLSLDRTGFHIVTITLQALYTSGTVTLSPPIFHSSEFSNGQWGGGRMNRVYQLNPTVQKRMTGRQLNRGEEDLETTRGYTRNPWLAQASSTHPPAP